jgi:hypothetical protein
MLHAANQLIHGRSLDDLVQPLLETIIGPLMTGVRPQPQPGRIAA